MAQVSLNTPAPDFTLNDYRGEPVTLSDFRGRQRVLLVFNRGFMWPFCRRHMAQVRQDYEKFQERDTVVVVAGPEDAAAFRDYFTENNLPFYGLPDPTHGVLKQFGQEVKIFRLGRMPAQVLVDRNGVVRYVHYGKSMRDIPENNEIVTLIDALDDEAAQE